MINFVYLTTNIENGKQYIGSHKGEENDNYLGSGKLLINAIKKYGKEKFKRKILEICDASLNLIIEEKYINEFNTLIPNGYNIHKNGGYTIWDNNLRNQLSKSLKGKKLSDDHKLKISKALIGKKRDPKIGKKIKETRIKNGSYYMSEEAKNKLSKKYKNKTYEEIHGSNAEKIKEKLSEAHKGFKHSEQSKLKMSILKKGFKHSEESKLKMKITNKGKCNLKGTTLSEEHKEKLSEAHKGKKLKRIFCEVCGQDIPITVFKRHTKKCAIST